MLFITKKVQQDMKILSKMGSQIARGIKIERERKIEEILDKIHGESHKERWDVLKKIVTEEHYKIQKQIDLEAIRRSMY